MYFLFKLTCWRSLTYPVLPAVLTVLPRLHIDLAGALSSADVLRCSLVLQGSSEECSAAEAGDGPVVDMSSSSLPAYLVGKCQMSKRFNKYRWNLKILQSSCSGIKSLKL